MVNLKVELEQVLSHLNTQNYEKAREIILVDLLGGQTSGQAGSSGLQQYEQVKSRSTDQDQAQISSQETDDLKMKLEFAQNLNTKRDEKIKRLTKEKDQMNKTISQFNTQLGELNSQMAEMQMELDQKSKQFDELNFVNEHLKKEQ